MDMNELLAHLEVRNNITQEALKEKARYEQGVKAMKDAQGIEASDYSVNSVTLANGVKWYNS